MHFRQPLHVGHAIPSRHDQPRGETLIPRQRLAIERISDHHVGFQGIFERHAAPKLLLEFVRLLPEDDVERTAVRAQKDGFPRPRIDRQLLQYRAQADAGKAPVRTEAFHRPGTVAGALVAVDDLGGLHRPEIGQRILGLLVHQARELQPVLLAIDLWFIEVLCAEELIFGRDRAVDLTDVEQPRGRIGIVGIERVGNIGEGNVGSVLGHRR